MKIDPGCSNKWPGLFVLLAVLTGFGFIPQLCTAQQADKPVPEVVSASVPFYPRLALAARISGAVHLHLSTDGKRVTSITDQKGPVMLIAAAEQNVRTWAFAEHIPTSFDVNFNYKVIDSPRCYSGNKPVILHLPAEVEVDGAPLECDKDSYFRLQKYLHEQRVYPVELHISLNGKPTANPPEVVIANSAQSVTLPVKEGLFLVPEAMATGSSLRFQAGIGQDNIKINGINPNQLESIWTIMLADKTFGQDYPVPKRIHVHSTCILSFDPMDGDGIYMTVDPCRKPASE
jgi:hypothetical protein